MIVDMSKVAAPTEPLPGRSCGGCTLCCKVLGVPTLEKPRGTWCLHCERGVGCRIYESRPGECRSFLCGWLVSDRFGPEWKPERSKIVITVTRDGNGFEFQCDPGFPQAWRKVDDLEGTVAVTGIEPPAVRGNTVRGGLIVAHRRSGRVQDNTDKFARSGACCNSSSRLYGAQEAE